MQIAAGFFFPISIGQVMQWVRESDIATVLWNFSTDCRKAGLSRFYASRERNAKSDLEKAFDEHRKGDILLTGPSLRLFLNSTAHFFSVIRRNIIEYDRRGVTIRIVNADLKKNVSLPIRAFVEEFNPDGTHPRGRKREPFGWESDPSDWSSNIGDSGDISLTQFCERFHGEHRQKSTGKCRCANDLESVPTGINELNRDTTRRVIHARRSICAPYFTAVIFPDICYYTPNMLYPTAPVNMPMLAFLRGGPVYDRVLTHFRFLWWSGEDY
jgi:hypothetical protein